MELISEDSSNSQITSYIGNYSGTYSGDDSGIWEFSIDSNGNIQGVAYSDLYGNISLSGNITDGTNGTMVMGDASYGVTFSGNINTITGEVSGTWSNTEGYYGTYKGYKN
ncbi:hypothetical protein [Nitrosophilus labii]|uniref:hypothetical protein n=1 Tax=Nitrosophilus labii TaxID=2706014 RepID=UPI0016570362|nr:hypothetical protein [Nitrosophilus labii]